MEMSNISHFMRKKLQKQQSVIFQGADQMKSK